MSRRGGEEEEDSFSSYDPTQESCRRKSERVNEGKRDDVERSTGEKAENGIWDHLRLGFAMLRPRTYCL